MLKIKLKVNKKMFGIYIQYIILCTSPQQNKYAFIDIRSSFHRVNMICTQRANALLFTKKKYLFIY